MSLGIFFPAWSGVASWTTPLDLFTGGRKGLWADFSDTTNQWQEHTADTTLAATAADPLGRKGGFVGTTLTRLAATSTAGRLVVGTGEAWGESDGANDFLQGAIGTELGGTVTMAVSMRTGASGVHAPIGFANNGVNNEYWSVRCDVGSAPQCLCLSTSGSQAAVSAAGNAAASTNYTLIAKVVNNGTGTDEQSVSFSVNSETPVVNNFTNVLWTPASGALLTIGSLQDSTPQYSPTGTRYYGVFIGDWELSEAETDFLETYLAGMQS